MLVRILKNHIKLLYAILSFIYLATLSSEYDLFKGKSHILKMKNELPRSNFYTIENKLIENGSIKIILKRAGVNIPRDFNYKNINFSTDLSLEINIIRKDTLQFILRDLNKQRFELPLIDMFPHHKEKINMDSGFDWKLDSLNLDFEFKIIHNPFFLEISRKNTKEVIFSTLNKDFFFAENYGEFSATLPSNNIFGLGERTTTFRLKSGIYTLYNKDLYGEIEDGKGQGKNRYGSHPMYLMRERSGNYHIVYLRNSHPMDVILNFPDNRFNSHRGSNKNTITYKVVGGVFDFSVFMGNKNPEAVTKKYHTFLGGYTLPPFWAMGFHQCRWGYKSLFVIQQVLDGYKNNNLPLDTIWMDIDYMNDYQPFTIDTLRYDLDEFKKTLKEHNKKFVMIIEPTIGLKNNDFDLLKKGIEMDLFIKNSRNANLINRVWPGRSYFVDYFNPNAQSYWSNALSDLKKKIDFSGIWLDMNEIAAFEAGQVDMDSFKISCEDPKKYIYLPGNKVFETATICPNAKHWENLEHIQVHNYYPNQQAKLTYDFLAKEFEDSYPFILTRANGPGMGKFAAHWSGDNYGTEEFLKFSISEVINSNLFGIPMTGADICGFGYDTPEYLCAKWYQMGALYPFSRSHSHMDYYRKEPFLMGQMLLETTRKSLQFRYSIMKYYYSLFIRNNQVGTIFRPVFFEFFNDEFALSDFVLENMFMIGDALLAVPNFNAEEIYESKAYFPAGTWFDLRTNLKVNKKNQAAGEIITIKTDLYEMPAVFLRGGKIVFRNRVEGGSDSFKKSVSSSQDLDNEFDLYIAFDSSEFIDNQKNQFTSKGFIPALGNYNSKSDVENCMKKNCFIEVTAILDKNSKNIKIHFNQADYYYDDFTFITINNIYVLGIEINISDIIKISYDKYIIRKNTEDSILFNYPEIHDNPADNYKILLSRSDIDVIINFK